MSLIGKLFATLVFFAISIPALSPLAAVFVDSGNSNYVFGAMLVVFALAAFSARNVRRAFGRSSLLAAMLFFALPLFSIVLSTKVGLEVVAGAGGEAALPEAAGATIAGGLMAGLAGFIGFFVGIVLFILALVLLMGGQREVIVVERKEPRFD